MNRRQKIIVSVTGIFIVSLILIGLTYAYFLTRITGNGNPTSISVTTANLELVYGDGTVNILTSETPLMPSSTPIGTKDFTVTNNGDDSEYVVVFEDITVKYAADTVINGQAVAAGTPTTFESNDFVYTLTCTVKDKNGNTLTDKSCDGVEEETFPMDGGIVVGNNIDKDDVHSYVLTMYYLDNGLDQSADMNKTLNGKVNIKDIKSINPYSENKNSLAYNIINNSMLNKNGTELLSKPLTTSAKGSGNIVYTSYTDPSSFYSTSSYASKWYVYGSEIALDKDGYFKIKNPQVGQFSSVATSMVNGYIIGGNYKNYGYQGFTDEASARKVMNNEFTFMYKVGSSTTSSTLYYGEVKKNIENIESILTTTVDDYGTSYYYRGGVIDNYVNFAGMCWRIVRIEGDGSVKLILEDQYTTCNDTEDVDGEGTTDYAYTGNWSDGNYYEFGHVHSAADGCRLNF